MPEVGRRPEPIGGVEIASSRNGGENLREVRVTTIGIVGVVGRNVRDPEPAGHLEEKIVAGIIIRHAVVREFDEEPTGEDLTQFRCSGHRSCEITGLCGTGNGTTPASGQGDEVSIA